MSRRSVQEVASVWHAALVEAADTAVVGVDPHGVVVSWNAAARQMFGLDARDAIGSPWSECLGTPCAGDLAALVEAAMEGRKQGPLDIVHDARGRLSVTVAPLADAQGGTFGVVLFARDVSRQRSAETALRDSEARYRAVVEDQTELICRFLPDGTLTFVNEAYCRYFGRAREWLVGRSFLELVPEADWQEIHKYLLTFGRDSSVRTYEHRVIRPDGTWAWQQWTDRALFDDKWHIREYQSVGRDITERKEAEEAVRRSEAQLRVITDAVPVLIARLDTRASFTFANRACEDWFGWPRSALRGQHLKHVIGERAYSSMRPYLERTIAGEAATFEATVARRDGSLREVSVSLVPEGGDRNASGGLFVVINDINERKRQEFLERRQLFDVAHVARLSTIGELTTEIAHELNQPLTAITTYGEALQRLVQSAETPTEEIADIAGEMRQQAERSAEIIRRVRQFARKQEPQYTELDLNSIVEEALRLLRVEARWHDVTVRLRLQADIPNVSADRILIQQVILNLARNGLEAMQDESVQQRLLTVTTRDVGGKWAEVRVEDSGKGLSDDALDQIFEPFFTTKADGLGLGLAISRSIVDNHGGSLSAIKSRRGGGVFRFRLPAAGVPE